mgnify:CR=1 FL=1
MRKDSRDMLQNISTENKKRGQEERDKRRKEVQDLIKEVKGMQQDARKAMEAWRDAYNSGAKKSYEARKQMRKAQREDFDKFRKQVAQARDDNRKFVQELHKQAQDTGKEVLAARKDTRNMLSDFRKEFTTTAKNEKQNRQKDLKALNNEVVELRREVMVRLRGAASTGKKPETPSPASSTAPSTASSSTSTAAPKEAEAKKKAKPVEETPAEKPAAKPEQTAGKQATKKAPEAKASSGSAGKPSPTATGKKPVDTKLPTKEQLRQHIHNADAAGLSIGELAKRVGKQPREIILVLNDLTKEGTVNRNTEGNYVASK